MTLWTAAAPNGILHVAWAVCHILPHPYIFNHIGEALHIKEILFHCLLIIKKSHATLFSLKCYVHRKRKHTGLNTLGILRGRARMEGQELGERNNGWSPPALNAKERFRQMEYITIVTLYVIVILYIEECYMNLQSDATMFTSFQTCYVSSEWKTK